MTNGSGHPPYKESEEGDCCHSWIIVALRGAEDQQRWERCAQEIALMVPDTLTGMVCSVAKAGGAEEPPSARGFGEFLPFLKRDDESLDRFIGDPRQPGDAWSGDFRLAGVVKGPSTHGMTDAEAEALPWSVAVDEILQFHGFRQASLEEAN